MKNLSLIGSVILLASCSAGIQYKKVPQRVREAFHKRHPDIETNFHLNEEDEVKTYEAHYKDGDNKFSERYSKDGHLLEVEKSIPLNSLDKEVSKKILEFLKAEDSRLEIKDIQKVVSAPFNGYEIKAHTEKSKTSLMEYFFNSDGSFVQKQEVKLHSIQTLN